MRLILAGTLAVVLASCASPPVTDNLKRWSPPAVTWKGNEPTTLPLDTVTLGGRVAFFAVEFSIDGKRASFLIDSGSSSTLFTDEFLRSLKGKVSGGQNSVIYGLGWSRKAKTIMLSSIDLGFARLDKLEIPSQDMLGAMFNQELTSSNGRPIAGIIGVDMLVSLGASLDLVKSTITFQKPPTQPPETTPPKNQR